MSYCFAQRETHYTLGAAQVRIPPYWPGVFGRPIRYKGQDGYMGKTRLWALGEERKLKLTVFYPLRVLHEALSGPSSGPGGEADGHK
jgi:hypothetical protein